MRVQHTRIWKRQGIELWEIETNSEIYWEFKTSAWAGHIYPIDMVSLRNTLNKLNMVPSGAVRGGE